MNKNKENRGFLDPTWPKLKSIAALPTKCQEKLINWIIQKISSNCVGRNEAIKNFG